MQGGHGTGKTGNLVLTFSRQGKHRQFCSDTGKNLLTQGKYLDCDYLHKKYVYYFKFQKFLTSEYYIHLFPHAIWPNFTCVFTLSLSIFMHNIYLGYEKTDVGSGVILK